MFYFFKSNGVQWNASLVVIIFRSYFDLKQKTGCAAWQSNSILAVIQSQGLHALVITGCQFNLEGCDVLKFLLSDQSKGFQLAKQNQLHKWWHA